MTQDINALQVTDAQLAGLVGLTARRIRQLTTEGKLQRVGRNAYELGESLRVLFAEAADASEGTELQKAKLRKLNADASLAELNLARERGLVALIEDFQQVQTRRAALIQANMLQVPARAVLQLLGERDESRFKAKLKAEIVLALKTAAETELDLDEEGEEHDDR